MKKNRLAAAMALLLLFSLFKAGAQQKNTLLWFVGKWEDKKTFLVDSNLNGGKRGGTVTLKNDGSFQITTPENKEFDNRINAAISYADNAKKNIEQSIRSNQGMYQYNLAMESKEELDKIKQDIKGYLVQPPEEKAKTSQASEEQLTKMLIASLRQSCINEEPEYRRIIDFFNANKKNKNEHFNLPPPPTADYFNCWSCDSTKQADFDSLTVHYANNFFKALKKDISKLLGWMKQLELLGHGESNTTASLGDMVEALFYQGKINAEKKGVCAYFNYSDMAEAVQFYVTRGMDMANQLLKENKKNYTAAIPVIKVYLEAQRAGQILGIVDQNSDAALQELMPLIKGLYDQMMHRMLNEKDYSFIANIPLLLGMQVQLILISGDVNIVAGDLEKIEGFPHFKLHIDVDAKVGSNGAYAIAHVKGDAHFVAELDEKKCLKFTLAKEEEGKIKLQVVTNEMIVPPDAPTPTYAGTKTYTSAMPEFKLHFCPSAEDTILFNRFVPLAPDKGLWLVPQSPPQPLGINGVDGLFIDMDKIKKETSDLNPQADAAQLEEMKKKAQAMAAKYQSGKMDQQQVAAMSKELMNLNEQAMGTKTMEFTRIPFVVKTENNANILVHQIFELAQVNPGLASQIVYGTFSIKLEHDPRQIKK